MKNNIKAILHLIAVLLLIIPFNLQSKGNEAFSEQMIFIDKSSTSQESLNMPWRNCITVGRAYELLRYDVVQHLSHVQDEIGYKYCRFHGIFHDDMAVAVERPDGSIAYQWHQVNKVYDQLLNLGLRPFVELSPMPKALASGTETIFEWKMNVTPPKSYDMWADLIYHFIMHCINRYGMEEVRKWYFEVWNEPDLKGFWSGTQNDYWKLYDVTAQTIKNIDQQLKVGGPATSKAAWIEEMIDHCAAGDIPIDFISTHSYPQDEYVLYKDRKGSPHEAGQYLTDVVKGVTRLVRNSKMPHLEIHWTEWNTMSARPSEKISWINNPTVDNLHAASFIVKNCIDLDKSADSFAYWVASDIFEESGMPHSPFSCTYGLLNIHGIPKASFNAFSILKQMRGVIHETSFKIQPPPGCGLLVTSELDVYRILIWNHHMLEIDNQEVWEAAFKLPVLNDDSKIVISSRIKEGAGSAYETWSRMGIPHNISPIEEKLLWSHAQPEYQFDIVAAKDDAITHAFKLFPGEVLYLELRPIAKKAVPKGAVSPDSKQWNIEMGKLSR